MDTVAGATIYPLNRCKILHLVRHAEGIHNVEGANKSKTSPELFDACLSPLGWEQVEYLRKHVVACGLFPRIQLVIVSPLLRTLQTAAKVFGGDKLIKGKDAVPLMVEHGSHTAVSSLDCPPFIAHELCRERLGVNTCDKRRSISEYKNQFSAVDFSLIESDEDALWRDDVRETDDELSARGLKFMNWLWTRKETEIAVVTHSAFLLQTLQALGEDCLPSMKPEICAFFKNCELRSVVLLNKGLIESDGAAANQVDTIIPELKPPSAIANGKQESRAGNYQNNGTVNDPTE